ncbi:MAG: hypothetical protein HOP16_01635 [Acidobacteria bacterium]|nr:hypothetical protein [Acidobacteriota bacterium]
MRLAWLRAHAPREHDPLDDIAALLQALRADHQIEIFATETLTGFASAHTRSPFDLGIYEITDPQTAAALAAVTVPLNRVLVVRTLAVNNLPALIAGSTITIVPYQGVADDLRARFPGADVRVVTVGVSGGAENQPGQQHSEKDPEHVVIGVFPPARADVVRRALAREGLSAEAAIGPGLSPGEIFLNADLVVSVAWPWAGEPAIETLVAMAAAKPVVTLETVGTAEWPALDPQSWRPRGPGSAAPVVVSIDPLDEEHSLGLALARLSKDAALRAQLGAAAQQWWQTHATPAHAAAGWNALLRESRPLGPPTDNPARL